MKEHSGLEEAQFQDSRLPESVLLIGPMPPRTRPTMGGNHRYLLNFVQVLSRLPTEPVLVCDEEEHYDDLLAALDELGVEIVFAPLCKSHSDAAKIIDRIIRSISPSLMHVNGLHGWIQPTLEQSRELKTVPLRIYTMHLPFGYIRLNEFRLLRWQERLPLRWSWRQFRKDRRFLSLFDEVLSVSYRYAELFDELRIGTHCQVTAIPNGIDVELFKPGSNDRDTSLLRIGAAGNLHPQKRFDLLLNAFQRVSTESGARVELHIAGEGPDRGMLAEQARRLGISSSVVFHGYVAKMPDFLSSLDIFAMTSDSEAAPYAALEAMSCGLPSLVTNVGDLGYIIEDGHTGLVVERGDEDGAAEALLALTENPALRQRFGQAARKRAIERFSLQAWDQSIEQYLRERLVRGRQGSLRRDLGPV
jgi:glycosyltransferase involved in cell wall biosynthesis